MDDRTRTVGDEALDPFFFREAKRPNEEKQAPQGPAAHTRPRRGPPLRTAVLVALAALIAFATYRFVTTERPPTGGRLRDVGAQPIGAATIALGDIKVTVGGLGAVTPLANVTVKTQINGQLIEVAFKEGQIVKKGDFLAQIDSRPYQLAESQYEGQLAHDQGLLDQALIDMTRYETLLKQNSIARQQAEDQRYLVKQTEGSVKSDQALIDGQKLNLAYARIVSPIDGRVGLRLVDAGNFVQTTDPGIAVLTQLQPISVIFIVPEDEIPAIMEQMKVGTPLEVAIYDRADVHQLAVGKVTTIDNQIDTTTGTVKIRAEFDNLDDKLFPNQFVKARLLIKLLSSVVTAPLTAIQRGVTGAYVYVIGADNTVSARNVELGPQDNGKVAVATGLAPGDRVVVDGADRLHDGSRVFVAVSDSVAAGGSGLAGPGEAERGGESGPQTKPPGAR
ncbi:efflux RND transporter periplasmic adaptor subunit [Methylocapsa polymorpha]|uniref:Efflux RND transporter periplasmic adaptor subunit n=1 Tax=Methylocapsa polymorpha TaxID=3080828 RepID=A0ABZ0HPW9_9HYPH|nr:efflux RND transporter periplasmic adaptor subunit [Methylocapsa sp. RX1]